MDLLPEGEPRIPFLDRQRLQRARLADPGQVRVGQPISSTWPGPGDDPHRGRRPTSWPRAARSSSSQERACSRQRVRSSGPRCPAVLAAADSRPGRPRRRRRSGGRRRGPRPAAGRRRRPRRRGGPRRRSDPRTGRPPAGRVARRCPGLVRPLQEGRQVRQDQALGLAAEHVVDPAVLVARLIRPPVVGQDGRRERLPGFRRPARFGAGPWRGRGGGPARARRAASPRIVAIARSSRPWRYSARPRANRKWG